MSRRIWGLGTRQTVVLFAVAILAGVIVAVILGPGRSHDGPSTPTVTRVAPGSRGSAAGVWVFGLETLRFDARLRKGGQLVLQGYGNIVGARAAVDLFDAPTGRVGELDARHNRLREVARLTPGTTVDDPFVPSVAAHAGAVWVVPDPGEVVRVDPATGSAAAPIPLPGPSDARATGVVASSSAVYAATATAEGVAVARIDPGVAQVTATRVLDGRSLDAMAADDTAVWLRSGATLLDLDPVTLAPVRTTTVPSAAGSAGVAAADGDAFLLTDGGAGLTRYDPGTDRFTQVARILDRAPPTVDRPASLIAAGGTVWAMVQRSGAGDLAVRVVGYDVRRHTTRAVDVPGRLAPGELAVSTR